MPWYEEGITSVAAATGATYGTLHTGANVPAMITEIGVFCNAATASSVGLIKPSNTPAASTSALGQGQNPWITTASTVNLDTAWSTAPTIGSIFLRKIVLPATIGAGVIWTWPNGLWVKTSDWLVFWNFGGSTGSALSIYAVWQE